MNRFRSAPRRRRLGGAVFGLALVTAVIVAMPAGARPAAGGANGKDLWKHVPGTPAATKNGHKAQIKAGKLRAYTLDRGAAAEVLATAPAESPAIDGAIISLPAPGGGFERFAVAQSPVMEPGLAARHPDIATYRGTGIDDRRRRSVSTSRPLGFPPRSAGPASAGTSTLTTAGPEPLRELPRARRERRPHRGLERDGHGARRHKQLSLEPPRSARP